MQQITITVDDDGQITVDVQEDGQSAGEPYKCSSVDECKQYVASVLDEEAGETPKEQMTEGPEDYSAMWKEEAAKRPENPNMMR